MDIPFTGRSAFHSCLFTSRTTLDLSRAERPGRDRNAGTATDCDATVLLPGKYVRGERGSPTGIHDSTHGRTPVGGRTSAQASWHVLSSYRCGLCAFCVLQSFRLSHVMDHPWIRNCFLHFHDS